MNRLEAFKKLNGYIPEILKESIVADPTAVSTALMLYSEAIELMKNERLSLYEFYKNNNIFEPYLEFLNLPEHPIVKAETKVFTDKLNVNLKQVGIFHEYSIQDIAILRSNSMYCIKKLKTNQFIPYKGVRGDKFHYQPYVQDFINVNSAIRLLSDNSIPDGVTLALIRDEIPDFSYFCFFVKSAGSLTMLTDAPEFSNPDQKFKRRNPGRNLNDRIKGSLFPYSILDYAFDEKGYPHVTENSKSLVPYQTEVVKLKKISELEPLEAAWAVLMFDLISEKFWIKQEVLTLSYTAESMTNLLMDTIDKKAVIEHTDFKHSTGFNKWMVDKYSNECEESKSIVPKDSYGTLDELRKVSLWKGRKLLALDVQVRANIDFDNNIEQVYKDYYNSIDLELIKKAIAKGELKAEFFHYDSFGDKKVVLEANMLSFNYEPKDLWRKNLLKIAHFPQDRTCIETGSKSANSVLVAYFYPETPKAIELVTGKPCPEILKNWQIKSPYYGNSILSDVDPIDSELDNPWIPGNVSGLKFNGFNPHFVVYFSKSALKAWKKKY